MILLKKSFVSLFLFVFFFSALAFAHKELSVIETNKVSTEPPIEDSMIVRFKLTNSIKRYLRKNDLDITGVSYPNKEIEALLTSSQLEALIKEKAWIQFSFPHSLLKAPDERYFNPQKIEEFLHSIHDSYPEMTALISIGKTLEGRDIYALKITDHPTKDEKEPAILINSMHHAREVMTPEVAVDMIDYLTSNYGVDKKVTQWVNDTEIWVIPMFNLDGNQKMWTDNSMWRKNTRGGYGVDLNRNYPTGWNSCYGSSGSKWSQTYRGPSPASEPETQAMMNFVSQIKPVFNISYHSYSELVLYPFGCRPQRTPVDEAVETIGKEIASKLDYKAGTPWELLYNADGGDIDWMYAEHQVIPYVIELNSLRDGGFHPDYDKVRDATVEKNRKGWMHILDRLHGASLQGYIRDTSFTEIEIARFDDQKILQNYKINEDGSFYIILNPGKFNVTFKDGTHKRKFTGMIINKKTTLRM